MANKPKPFRPVVATANDLASGIVVFRNGAGEWSPDIADAEVAATADGAETLRARAAADQDRNRVVGVDLVEIVRDGVFIRPAALRELIRASGPTIALPFSAR